MLLATTSERQGRVIDFDEEGSMEQKKKEGYFMQNDSTNESLSLKTFTRT